MLHRTICFISLLAVCFFVGSVASAVEESDESTRDTGVNASEPAATDAAENEREASESAASSEASPEPSRFRFRPPEPPATDFLWEETAELDLNTGVVTTRRSVGGVPVGEPKVQTLDAFMDEYIALQLDDALQKKKREAFTPSGEDEGMRLELAYDIPNLPPMAKSIIGDGPSTLRISGYGRITMSGRTQFQTGDDVQITGFRQSKFPTLTMKQELSFQINGTIGSKIFVSIDQDTKRLSDLENSIRIRYQGEEDEVVKEVELGNTNLSLQGPQFISGGRQNRGLFGIKGRAQWGEMEWTFIASQQKSSTQKQTYRGGAQATEVSIRDIDYLRDRLFFLDESFRFQYGKSLEDLRANPTQTFLNDLFAEPQLIDVEVYVSVTYGSTNPNSVDGVAIVDSLYEYDTVTGAGQPNRTVYDYETLDTAPPEHAVRGSWQRIDDTMYQADLDLGYIDFATQPPQTNQDVAVKLYYTTGSGERLEFPAQTGTADTTGRQSMVLKLVKKANQAPSDRTWKLAWRHVYSVNAGNLKWDDFELDIVNTRLPNRPNTTVDGTKTYMQIFGLDVANSDMSAAMPDQIVDANQAKINLAQGIVIFPFLEPFREAFELADPPIPISGDDVQEGSPQIYQTNSAPVLNDATRYSLVAKYSRPSSRISLGFDLLEDSEVVRLNGRKLTRGADYTINYFTGELTFTPAIAQQVTEPNADLTIDYESNPLFKPDQETLLGARGTYRLGENGQVGTTFMFNSERSGTFRVRVGEEPTRMTMVGADVTYEFRPFWLTRAVDRLPLIETDEGSLVRFEGEVARSMPNLNTRGLAYIDDFESAGNVNSIGVYQRSWSISSRPLSPLNTSTELLQIDRGRLAWFNTQQVFVETDVWDQAQSSGQQNRIPIMHFWFRPKGETPNERAQSWAGIMKSYGTGGIDLQRTQYIEIWMRIDTTETYPGTRRTSATLSGAPRLHIDLGTISEDVYTVPSAQRRFAERNLNSEDFILRGENHPPYVDPVKFGAMLGDGILNFTADDAGEDVGLDGCPDEYEDGLGGCLPTPTAVGDDPNGDNWISPTNLTDPRQFYGVNGTEGNRRDGNVFPTPDSEDLNGNGRLDITNNYYSYTIDLRGFGRYAVEGSEQRSGFRHFRIPIQALGVPEVGKFGDPPSFEQITNVRMWVTGVEDSELWLTFASLDFVGSDWEEIKKPDDPFAVATVNTQETPNYVPPPEAEVEYESDGTRRREQSLSLQFARIHPGESFSARRVFLQSKDFTNYRRMRMFIYGPFHNVETGLDPMTDHLSAFLRFGTDSTSYYEIEIPRLYPGWDARNYVDIPLDTLTQLKLDENGDIITQSGATRLYQSGATLNRLRVVGYQRGASIVLPTLSDVKMIEVGITNATTDRTIYAPNDTRPIAVWFDDLHLRDARNLVGQAARGSMSIKMADFVSFQASATQQDVGFRSLQSVASGISGGRSSTAGQQASRNINLSMDRLRIDKFLPPSWRVQIPLNMSYSTTSSTPRLKPNSDIELVREDDKENERRHSHVFNASTSYTKTSQSPNALVRLTLDRSTAGVTYSTSTGVTPTASARDSTKRTSYTARFGYDLTPRGTFKAKPLNWLGPLLPESISSTEVTYLPNTLRFDASTTFSYDTTRSKKLNLPIDTTYASGRKTFSLSEAYRAQIQPLRSLSANYDLTFARDLQDEVVGKASPGEMAEVIAQSIFRENEIRRNHKFNVSYSPPWPSWLTHSYSFSNTYTDDSDPRTSAGFTTGREYSVNSQQSYNLSNYTIRIREILSNFGGAGRSTPSGQRGGNNAALPADSASSRGVMSGAVRPTASFLSRYIENITGRVGYTDQYTGAQLPEDLRPGLMYQVFGYGDKPPLDAGANLGVRRRNSISQQLQYDIGSGIGLPFNMRIRGKYSFRHQRQFTISDTTRSQEVTFPDLNYSWNGLESLPVLNVVATNSDIQSAFQRSLTEQWKSTEASQGEYLASRRTAYRLSPLFAWNILWKNNVRSTLRSTWDRSYTDTPVGSARDGSFSTTISTNWSIGLTANYELQTARGIPLFGRTIRLKGNVNMSADASYGGGKSIVPGGGYNNVDLLQSHTRSWSFKPRASYRFSQNFTGQADMEIGQQKDIKLHRTTHIRAVSISGELRFN